MKNSIRLLGALVTTAGLAAFGAGIEGVWTARVPGKTTTQRLTLRSSGMNLTGWLDAGDGYPVGITEGMVHDAEVTFKVVRWPNTSQVYTINCKGVLVGDELRLTETAEGPPGHKSSEHGGSRPGGRSGPQEMTFKRTK